MCAVSALVADKFRSYLWDKFHNWQLCLVPAWLHDWETITGYENTGCACTQVKMNVFYLSTSQSVIRGPCSNISFACASEWGVLSVPRFCYVFPCDLWGPAVGSYSISQSAWGTSGKHYLQNLATDRTPRSVQDWRSKSARWPLSSTIWWTYVDFSRKWPF